MASRHGATAEVAERIGIAIRAALPSATVDVRAAGQVTTVDGYDAVVLGSAVYAGCWLGPARDLVVRHGAALAGVPVWLFSSGPVGDPPRSDEDPAEAAEFVAAIGAREHVVFAGKLDRHRLGFAERAVTAVVRAPRGDFRDWAAIDAWAGGIAETLRGK
ncbi:flavodoxin domain-containing protein [Plantactinospora sp. B6F1]|uniref:flavodoxin domain-containing protein n=1 Tax=Plantactinospora sp. B6F1 TaxID=3158971 RepID=UPI0032D95299